jgi:hypothetical protein
MMGRYLLKQTFGIKGGSHIESVQLKLAHTALNTGNSHNWRAGWVAETLVNKAREHKYCNIHERPVKSSENSIAKSQHDCKTANV